MRKGAKYSDCVFVNAPFDVRYRPIFNALVFTIHDCGFIARCTLEIEDSSEIRIESITKLIRASQFGIHDISRAGVDRSSRLARFNMPLELGLFLGAKRFGVKKQREKRCLILDTTPYRYQVFCSDIAGQDIRDHNNTVHGAIAAARNWCSAQRPGTAIPSASRIATRYRKFRRQLPALAEVVQQDADDLTFGDYAVLVVAWLTENSW